MRELKIVYLWASTFEKKSTTWQALLSTYPEMEACYNSTLLQVRIAQNQGKSQPLY